MKKNIGLIGFGAIGRTVTQAWCAAPIEGHNLTAVLARAHQVDEARALLGGDVFVTADADEFLSQKIDMAIELAGQSAVVELGARTLAAGIDFMLLSVGSLARQDVFDDLLAAASAGGARVFLPVGAIAGLDGLLALRMAGLKDVTYRSTKPPASWKGTPAEALIDLDGIQVATEFFHGTAREAALQYPKNANLAAAVALAGLGLDETKVVLAADPLSSENIGRIEAEGEGSKLLVMVTGKSEASNPKSSRITGMSVLAALNNDAQLISFS